MKRSLDARLDVVEENLNRKRRRSRTICFCLQIFKGESVAPIAFDPETGRGPLIIHMGDPRPLDKPISESDRPFIISASIDDVEPES